MVKVISFEDALAETDEANARKHLLLGNGFSRACRDDIFAYGALFDRADFKALSPTAKSAFSALGTTDFEVVMKALKNAAAVVEVYAKSSPKLAKRMHKDAEGLREALAKTIASSHPDRPGDISFRQYGSCRDFINHFDSIYTLNYDLLLYWALMQTEIPPPIRFDDGFRQPEDGPAEYVTWDVQNTQTQNVYYLHGALHIFDAGAELQKFTWSNTQIALVEQIREALAQNRFPLFVAEGSHKDKLDRIQHSGFLNRAYRSFASISGTLFVFGHSLAERDEHILKLLDRGRVSQVYVGLYGDPSKNWNRPIIRRAKLIPVRRADHRPRSSVKVTFYDAESAKVWEPA